MRYSDFFGDRVLMVEMFDHHEKSLADPNTAMIRVYGRLHEEDDRFLTLSLIDAYNKQTPTELNADQTGVFIIVKSAIHKVIGFMPISPLSPQGVEIFGGKFDGLDPDLQKILFYGGEEK